MSDRFIEIDLEIEKKLGITEGNDDQDEDEV